MKYKFIVLFALIQFTLVAAFTTVLAQEKLTAYQIMEKVDARPIPSDQKSEMTMNLIDKKGKIRSRSVKTYRIGDEKQIMWFLEPADVKGSCFLRISYDDRNDDMWIYLPAFGKVRRVASHQKNGNFMGSDFTYEDMEKIKLENYDYKLLGEEEISGKGCWMIERRPKEGVSKDYSRIVGWVWKDHYSLVKNEFYAKNGNLKKVMTIEPQQFEKYWLPQQITMENLKSKHKTELIFENIRVDTGIEDEVFKSSYMKRIH